MGKKDKGKAKDKGKVPKNIAGVKVPKALRTAVAGSLLDNPRTREILADVIMAAAGAAAAALVRNRPSGRQVAAAGEAVVDAGAGAATATRDVAHSAAGLVTDVVAEAARHILPASLTGTTDEARGKSTSKTETYPHLAEDERKDKKDKKASKH